jgi:hypothetical protein
MDISNIVGAAESLLYQVALWIVLVPKTLVRIVVRPTWIPDYIAQEWTKPEERRFDDYVSPLLLFVLVAIVPNLIANVYWPQIPYSDFLTSRRIVSEAKALSEEHRLLLYSMVWVLLPLSYAIVHQHAQRGTMSQSQLKPVFYVQCLRLAPLGALFGLRFVIAKAMTEASISALNWATILVAVVWVVYSDVRISMRASKVTRARALVLALEGLVCYYLLLLPVLGLSMLLG